METGELVQQEQAIEALSRNCRHSKNLELIPDLVVEVVEKGWWQVRRPAKMMGKEYHYSTFQEFVEDHPPQGLGVELDTLKKLCRDSPEALVAIREAGTRMGNPDRTNQYTASTNNISTSEERKTMHGTYKDYTLYRIKNERPDLYERVLAGEMSANKAAINAGFRKKTVTVPLSVEGFVTYIQNKFSEDDIAEIARQLS